ncbi:hypothetical protein Pint_07032 [Pistacia integerrima]|uniref:Uncharacterized protein n=1 Tax=Pistacia integerrima TaxID=434235 RepID=A0ACC0XSJ4_9ROSI|nr:hypothetical protein Pint_07032 [Pistacia integerrima]
MNQLHHRKNAFGAREETHGFEFSDQGDHPVGVSDSNARAELLDIILMKVIGEADFQRNRDLEKLAEKANGQVTDFDSQISADKIAKTSCNFPDWREEADGRIPCPPKAHGGCVKTFGAREAAHRDNSQDNYLCCPTATQLGNNEIEHFQMHWMRGTWLTNFVGILSQGLRIAHLEAPATGYMVYLHCKTN